VATEGEGLEPGPPAGELEYTAVQLFVERAQAVQPGFVLGPENAMLVAALCARLEGLPLALELAAARLPALSLPEILERLDHSVRLLVGGSRTAPTRQQTLRATLDWSHDLLSPAEQLVVHRVAVFAGGWTLEAAEAVCTDAAIAGRDVLELLARLVDKSLVVAGERDGRSRYRLLEPIRQYAWEQLASSGELDVVRQRHATFFLAFAEALDRDERGGRARRGAVVDALKGEYPNLQVALQWAVDAGEAEFGLRLARTLQFVWKFRLLPADEGRLWIEGLLRLPGADAPTPARAVALLTEAWLSWRLDSNAAEALYAEALALARRLGDPWVLFRALSDRGLVAMHSGDYRTARACWEEGLPRTQASGDRAAEAVLLSNLGRVAILDGDYARGRARCEEVLRLGRELGDDWTIGLAKESLRMAAQSLGELPLARALATECLSLFHGAPFPTGNALRALAQIDIAEGRYTDARQHLGRALVMGHDSTLPTIGAGVVDTLAGLAAHLGQPEVALRLSAAAEAAWAAVGEEDFPFNRELRDRWLTPLRQTLSAEDTGRWWAEGRSLTLSNAIALAEMALPLPTSGSVPSPTGDPVGPLTPRQQEVAVLVGQGLTNRQIAERLVITERAVAAHVEHILDKLGVGSRAQIAVWASERGLLMTRSV